MNKKQTLVGWGSKKEKQIWKEPEWKTPIKHENGLEVNFISLILYNANKRVL